MAIVFSKDRPLQLDATLSSFELNSMDGDTADIHVLFRASTARYAAGYRVLAAQHPRVVMHAEANFQQDLLGLLTGPEHVLFIVDDTIFVAEFSLVAAIDVLALDRTLLGFSYRLGRNTTYCYTLDKPQQLPVFDRQGTGILSFDWTGADQDFAYPLEVSSSLYRMSDILPIIERLAFHNPNTLETRFAQEASGFRATRPRLACPDQSVAFSVPANLVQTAWGNRVDGRAAVGIAELEDQYDRGYRLDVESYRGYVSRACHEELEFRFSRDATVPTVSVVIPCYNQAAFLEEAVDSVVAQTFDDWEIVVVDDGSTDDTYLTAASLARRNPRKMRVISQPNSGLPSARNTGIQYSMGRYILPLDADDAIRETMLERLVSVLEAQRATGVVYTDVETFGDGSASLKAGVWSLDALCRENQLSYCSMYRRELWEAVGGYNPNMLFGYEDWDFWIGAANSGYGAVHLDEALFRYRLREGSMLVVARAHDAELRAQITRNHPSLFTPGKRLRRAMKSRWRSVAWKLRRRAGADPTAETAR